MLRNKQRQKQILQEIKLLAIQGLRECWPVPPESGWELAKAKRYYPEKATKLFLKKWLGEFKLKGEKEKEEMQLCFGSDSPASLFLEKSNNKSQLNYLIGLDNKIIEDQKALTKKIDNKIINELFY
mgnify:CR=1 FL=1